MTEYQVPPAAQAPNSLARAAHILGVIALVGGGVVFLFYIFGGLVTALNWLLYLALLFSFLSGIVSVVAIVLSAVALGLSGQRGSRPVALRSLIFGIVALLLPPIGLAISAVA